jgi:hypothetical protein
MCAPAVQPRRARCCNLNLGMLGAADTWTDPDIHLGLHNPATHRLNTQPFPSRKDPRQLGRRRILRAMLSDHPHHPLTHRGLNLLWRLHILLNSERCGMKPRTLHSAAESPRRHYRGRIRELHRTAGLGPEPPFTYTPRLHEHDAAAQADPGL